MLCTPLRTGVVMRNARVSESDACKVLDLRPQRNPGRGTGGLHEARQSLPGNFGRDSAARKHRDRERYRGAQRTRHQLQYLATSCRASSSLAARSWSSMKTRSPFSFRR